MIWQFIRDFLVQYIFGGTTSDGQFFDSTLGWYYDVNIGDTDVINNQIQVCTFKNSFGVDVPIYLGDWLSTTATIIIMCAIVFCFALLVRWIFKAVASAFLLK